MHIPSRFVLCEFLASLLTRHVGYGNAAGFLMNRNLGVPASVSGIDSDDEEEGEGEEVDMPSKKAAASAAATTSPTSPLSPVTPTSAISSSSSPSSAATTAGVKSSTTTTVSSYTRTTSVSTTIESAPLNRRMSSTSASSAAVNPITGAYYPDPSAIRTAMADMTEEEKEEEAGRLLDLFDKLRRTGVMDVRNPALEAGLKQRERDRYYDEQERKEQEEDEELERIYGKV